MGVNSLPSGSWPRDLPAPHTRQLPCCCVGTVSKALRFPQLLQVTAGHLLGREMVPLLQKTV